MTDNLIIKRIIFTTIIIFCVGLSYLLFKERIHLKYHSLRYSKEIQYAKKCVTLLAKGDEEKLRNIFVKNAHFFDSKSYLLEAINFFDKINIDKLRLKRLSTAKDEEDDIIFIEFEYEADHEQFYYMGLKFLAYPENLLLYSIMLG